MSKAFLTPAMLAKEINEEQTLPFIHSTEWAMQQKFDGIRLMAQIGKHQAVTFTNRKGEPIKSTTALDRMEPAASILEQFVYMHPERFPEGSLIDGEILDNRTYVLFDVLNSQHPELGYLNRTRFLERSVPASPFLHFARTETTTEAKRLLLDIAKQRGIEGVMLRNLQTPYEPRRTDNLLKHKFVKSADVVVTDVHRPDPKHGTIRFGVFNEGTLVEIGRCSAIGKEHVEPGDVIEIDYLYWTGSTTYQPRMKRVRADKPPLSCALDQFPEYSREVLHKEDDR